MERVWRVEGEHRTLTCWGRDSDTDSGVEQSGTHRYISDTDRTYHCTSDATGGC